MVAHGVSRGSGVFSSKPRQGRKTSGEERAYLDTDSDCKMTERGCVVLDQPQRVGKHSDARCLPRIQYGWAAAAGLRQSRAPGQCHDAPSLIHVGESEFCLPLWSGFSFLGYAQAQEFTVGSLNGNFSLMSDRGSGVGVNCNGQVSNAQVVGAPGRQIS